MTLDRKGEKVERSMAIRVEGSFCAGENCDGDSAKHQILSAGSLYHLAQGIAERYLLGLNWDSVAGLHFYLLPAPSANPPLGLPWLSSGNSTVLVATH